MTTRCSQYCPHDGPVQFPPAVFAADIAGAVRCSAACAYRAEESFYGSTAAENRNDTGRLIDLNGPFAGRFYRDIAVFAEIIGLTADRMLAGVHFAGLGIQIILLVAESQPAFLHDTYGVEIIAGSAKRHPAGDSLTLAGRAVAHVVFFTLDRDPSGLHHTFVFFVKIVDVVFEGDQAGLAHAGLISKVLFAVDGEQADLHAAVFVEIVCFFVDCFPADGFGVVVSGIQVVRVLLPFQPSGDLGAFTAEIVILAFEFFPSGCTCESLGVEVINSLVDGLPAAFQLSVFAGIVGFGIFGEPSGRIDPSGCIPEIVVVFGAFWKLLYSGEPLVFLTGSVVKIGLTRNRLYGDCRCLRLCLCRYGQKDKRSHHAQHE